MLESPIRSRRSREIRQVFHSIYVTQAWGDCESVSGPGSTRERSAGFVPDLVALIGSLKIAILLDVPCGDFNWAEPLAGAVDHYVGVDIVPALVRANRSRWSAPNRRFLCRDMVSQALPSADLVFCRDALVHLSEKDVFAAMENLRRTGAEYLIATTFVGPRTNADISTGEWRPLNMERGPFRFPPPMAMVDERCHHTGGIYSDKRLALWKFEDVPARG